MKYRSLLLMSAAILFCTASISAQFSHTWVSWSGSDSNTCTSSSPCLTFSGALSKTAPGGVITARDAGDYGPVYINQSVTIDGNNLGSIAFGASIPIYIAGGANVTIQNLAMNGLGQSGYAISAVGGGLVTIKNCNLSNFTIDGINYDGPGNLTVENSRIDSFIGTGGVVGIGITSNSAANVMIRNTVIDASPFANNNAGIVISGTGPLNASLENVTIMGGGNSAIFASTGTIQITRSVITQSGYGVGAELGATVSIANSLITGNTIGVCSSEKSKIRLDNNDIYDNMTAIAGCDGIVKTSGNNKTSGTISIPASLVSDSVTF